MNLYRKKKKKKKIEKGSVWGNTQAKITGGMVQRKQILGEVDRHNAQHEPLIDWIQTRLVINQENITTGTRHLPPTH